MSHAKALKRWLLVSAGLGSGAAFLPWLVYWQRLPEPLATHWGPDSAPNSALPKAGFLLVLAGGILLPLALGWPRKLVSMRPAPLALGSVVFGAALMAAVSLSTLWLNLDRADWRGAGHFSGLLIAPLVGAPFAMAAGAFAIARRVWPSGDPPPSAPTEALPLAPGERAYWSGSAFNGGLVLLALFVMLEGGVLHLAFSKTPGMAEWNVALHAFVVILFMFMWKVRVTLNERELTIHYGQLGWPRQRIPLDRILSAQTFELVPMEHGGWGYRGSLKLTKRAAVVVRSGLALRLELEGGKRLSITVDDAETAARLINGFVNRREDLTPNPPTPALAQPS
jgi:hypothetical protein